MCIREIDGLYYQLNLISHPAWSAFKHGLICLHRTVKFIHMSGGKQVNIECLINMSCRKMLSAKGETQPFVERT